MFSHIWRMGNTEHFLGFSEGAIRLAIFLAVFGGMALWEVLAPWREARQGRAVRWPGNLGIVVVDILVARLLFPASAVGVALWAEAGGHGLLRWLEIGGVWAGVIGFVALDFMVWAQHVMFHRWPLLWRVHRMHHADTELDMTSGLRFHPIEILVSLATKAALIIVLGVPATAVLVFEIVLNSMAIYNHSNVRLPERFERILRWFVVTPEMHVIHHSTEQRETDSNFGFNLTIWDRMFGTYTVKPAAGYDGMTIGLDEFRDRGEQRLDRLLTQPFRQPERR
jgi:sterol desaturase/sphingolipid hydroxylase (fatty acid hydroxylase superfamily)